MKKTLLTTALMLACVFVGGVAGWWASSPGFDVLCSAPFTAVLTKDIEADGIAVNAGTLVSLRSCEYADRFTINLYYSKDPLNPILSPVERTPTGSDHAVGQYQVLPAAEEP